MKKLVLVGGGHAQLAVLQALARQRAADIDAVLVTPSPWQYYSGMLPGFIAGHYAEADCRIDLRPLAKAAGVRLQLGQAVELAADERQLRLAEGSGLDYDLLSLDPGSATDLDTLAPPVAGAPLADPWAAEHVLAVKPLAHFFALWPQLQARALAASTYQLCIVGGGAAGVELALAAAHALKAAAGTGHAGIRVSVLAPAAALLPGHAQGVRARVTRRLADSGILVVPQRAHSGTDGLRLADGRLYPADCVIAATGARALPWLERSGLACSDDGWIEVGDTHESLSHPEVFAAGDCCTRLDPRFARSGVHAVHAGPVLAHNLLAHARGEALRHYTPRRHSLYLIACGPRWAIASWGRWSAQGRWVWRWKDWIDRRFIRSHSV